MKAEGASGTAKLHAVQEAADIEARIKAASAGSGVDLPALEKAFVKVAASYGEAEGISYSSWRAVGVPAEVLKKAKIARTRS